MSKGTAWTDLVQDTCGSGAFHPAVLPGVVDPGYTHPHRIFHARRVHASLRADREPQTVRQPDVVRRWEAWGAAPVLREDGRVRPEELLEHVGLGEVVVVGTGAVAARRTPSRRLPRSALDRRVEAERSTKEGVAVLREAPQHHPELVVPDVARGHVEVVR